MSSRPANVRVPAPGTASSSGPATPHSSSFTEHIAPIEEDSPYSSAPVSLSTSASNSKLGSTTALSAPALHVPRRFFHSRRVKKGDIQKPWLEKRDPREKWITIIPCTGLAIGMGIIAMLIYLGVKSVVNHTYCLLLDEDWSGGWNHDVWTREVECGGFGNGQFEYTTLHDENVFIKDNILHIKPTLQDENLITSNHVLNLTDLGICSSPVLSNCVSVTNTTAGNGTIINPVKSGRINTKKGASLRYGRIEVQAKLPAGKWLWPAIWMLPVEDHYGPWPASGEMDLVESRGNDYKYPQGGNNIISSTLHWGPDSPNDAFWRTNVKHKATKTTFTKSWHTFGIEWSENYIFTYVDSRLQQVLYTNFNERLWERGQFPLANGNGTAYVDPWDSTGNPNTPFDQEFYLILNVAVGGTNGWFADGDDGKPWVDRSHTARKDFWDKRDEWYPTWENAGEMLVRSVKIWKQCD